MMRTQNPPSCFLLHFDIWHSIWYMALHLIYGTPFESQLEGNTPWSTLILIKIYGHKIRCKMKTNGYLILNCSSLDVYEPQCLGFWPLVINHFNVTVLTFCGWFELIGMTQHGWQFDFNCPAIVQTAIGAVKTCLSFSEVDCCYVL